MPRARVPISVVIPTYNARHLLEKHLPEVVEVLAKGDEIVIADDASTDDTVNWVNTARPLFEKQGVAVTLTRNSKNQRFAATVNAGVAKASHNFVLLLNNDVSPLSEDIVPLLLEWFQDPETFAVGCAEVTTDKPGAQVSGRGTGNFERGLITHWYDHDQSISKTLWTAGGSMMVDRQKFVEIGGMDTLFSPAYEEDRDLSYRALKHGWKIAFEPHAVVHHQHETTNVSVFGRKKVEIMSWKNQFLLVWKNVTSTPLLLQHFFWLPYHLTVTAWRTRGTALLGFFRALRQLDAVFAQRRNVAHLWKKSDIQVLKEYGSQRPNMG